MIIKYNMYIYIMYNIILNYIVLYPVLLYYIMLYYVIFYYIINSMEVGLSLMVFNFSRFRDSPKKNPRTQVLFG